MSFYQTTVSLIDHESDKPGKILKVDHFVQALSLEEVSPMIVKYYNEIGGQKADLESVGVNLKPKVVSAILHPDEVGLFWLVTVSLLDMDSEKERWVKFDHIVEAESWQRAGDMVLEDYRNAGTNTQDLKITSLKELPKLKSVILQKAA